MKDISRSVVMSESLKIEKQPEFPACDLSVENARIIPFVIDTGVIEARAYELEAEQAGLYVGIAHHALELYQNQKLELSNEALRTFSEGFAAYETIGKLVTDPHVYNTEWAVNRLQTLYTRQLVLGTDPGQAAIAGWFIEDVELSNRMQMFPVIRPHLAYSLGRIAERLEASPDMLDVFNAGAEVAFELERPTFDRL